MACPASSDRSFGPRVSTSCRAFDFTLTFEDIVFTCMPAAAFLYLLPLNFTYLLRLPPAAPLRSKLSICKIILLVGLFCSQIAVFASRVNDSAFHTSASVAADVLALFAAGAAIVLSLVDHQRSIRPSTLLALYLSVSALVNAPRVRTAWLIHPGGNVAGSSIAVLTFMLLAVFAESISRATALQVEKPTPEQYSGFWNRTIFIWLVDTFRTGYSKVISVDDLPALDIKLRSQGLHEALSSTWAKYNQKEHRSLIRACIRSYGWSLFSPVIPRLCLSAFTFGQPFLITATVSFTEEGATNKTYGKGLIGAWALVYIGLAASRSVYLYQDTRFRTRLRGGLIALIYERALQIRTVDAGDVTAIAVMGTDAERIFSSLVMLHETWSSVIDVGIATWLLQRQLGLACIAPIVVVGTFIAATFKLSAKMSPAQKDWIGAKQERLRVTSALVDDIKTVKMQGLSETMASVVSDLRKTEIRVSEYYRKLLVIMILLSNTPINLAPAVTFAVYVIIAVFWKDATLMTAQAFTSVALVSLLATPVLMFIQALPQVTQCIGCFDRIQEYCNYAQSQSTAPYDDDSAHGSESGTMLNTFDTRHAKNLIENAVLATAGQKFHWNRNSPAVLHDLDVKIQKGRFTAVLGPVGSGKSTLLASLLNETIAEPESAVARSSEIAFCSQDAWLEYATVRYNIVGVSEFDEKWYATVINACGLTLDLANMENGDFTLIGSKGLNLSGGQKQRIALARAAYARHKIVVLDDVFSGMDAHTSTTVSKSLLGRNGLFRRDGMTVVVATHNQKVLALADTIIALQDGRTVETAKSAVAFAEKHAIDSSRVKVAEIDEYSADEGRKGSDPALLEEASEAKHELSASVRTSQDLIADKARQRGNLTVYSYYIKSAGYKASLVYGLFTIAWEFCTYFPTIWLKWWSEANMIQPNKDVGMYMGVYAMFCVLGSLCACLAAWYSMIDMISNSALRLHTDVLDAVTKAPFRFFATTNTGTITNRFGEDMELIDLMLCIDVLNFTSTVLACLMQVIIMMVFARYLGVTVPVLIVLLYFLQRFYLRTSRQMRLLGIEAKAPLYTTFTETVTGASTIRAFGWQEQYQMRAYQLIDTSQRPTYIQACIQHWLGFVMDLTVCILCVILVATVTTWTSSFNSGSVGVSLVMIVGFNTTLGRLIVTWTKMESSVGAVARCKLFATETEKEDNIEQKSFEDAASAGWLDSGRVELQDVTARYRPDTEPVLKNLSLIVQAREHVAVCGRSGSGKSSLVLTLLRMIEMRSGQITIDDVDVSTLSGEYLRSCLNVVPQDPLLIPATMRFNIDPVGTAQDGEILRALARVQLADIVLEQGGLDKQIDTAAWSAGQKQLLCFARAMVRKRKILILDEASSSVDAETQTLMQDIIDTEFKNCTVLAVIHRLDHIESYDKVALLENGVLMEYDTPEQLLAGPTRFAKLHSSGGH